MHPLQQARRLPVHGRGQGRRARLRRPPGADTRERDAAHERARQAARDRRERHDRDERGRRPRTACPSATARNIVVVSAGAVNSAALLLRSANEDHPHGLANSSGVVGRHYMAHINSALVAVSKDPNPTRFQKTLGVNDFYHGSDDFEFPLGHIQMLGKSDREVIKEGAPVPTPGLRARLHREPRGRLLAHLRGSARSRQPRDRRSQRAHPRGLHRHATTRATAADRQAQGPARRTSAATRRLIPNQLIRDGRIPLGGVAHQCGTVRFGDDPETSALDVNCKAHDLDNLYVVDTSFFPSLDAP